ncbi:MAG TPA: dienelactone hydrolase family protein, partial [Chthoniobacterales bacterium]
MNLPKLFTLLLATATPALADLSFEYDRDRPLDVRETTVRHQDGAILRDITYASLDGTVNAATVIAPNDTSAAALRPAVLFVHWYGPPEPTSNRTQFIPDGIELAKSGVVSLLIDTPWSRFEYFRERKREDDYTRSVQQVKDLRRALDVLLSLPKVDPARVAYVGHDFGAMYGALAASCDTRTKAFVFMAGTPSFSDWFLYGRPQLEGAERQKFVDQLAPLDPIRYLPKLKMPTLLQFADDDEHVPMPRANALTASANEPKTVRIYSAGHELNDAA